MRDIVCHLGGGTMKIQPKWIFPLLLMFSVGNSVAGQEQESNRPDEEQTQESDRPTNPPEGGWHRFGEPAARKWAPAPSLLTLPAGSWIAVRADQPLSSDHNLSGDPFTATLAQPLVANGRVIARRGQTVGGVVATAEKAGRVKGTSRLGVQLTELSLVNGRQIPIRTSLVQNGGGTSVGTDVGAVATTSAVGATIGAIADGGFGAGMGAIAGAAAATIGVLVTRGQPTVIYPEDVLTFRLEEPVNIPVESPEAFQPVSQGDYEQTSLYRRAARPQPPPYPYPYYGGYYAPYFWGPSFYFYSGPRFFYGHGYYHGGYGGFHYHH